MQPKEYESINVRTRDFLKALEPKQLVERKDKIQ